MDSMTLRDMGYELNVSYVTVHNYKKELGYIPRKVTPRGKPKHNKQDKIVKKVKSPSDFSTRGNFDINKWADCLPI